MTTVLLVYHTPSPRLCAYMQEIITTIENFPIHEICEQPTLLRVESVPALHPKDDQFLQAHAYIFLTPANIGYISGALKHYFDITYNIAHTHHNHKPYTAIISGNSDTSGATHACRKICHGMGLKETSPIIEIQGESVEDSLLRVHESIQAFISNILVSW